MLRIGKKLKDQGKEAVKIRNAQNALDAFRDKAGRAETCFVCEAEKCAQWYRILKKIFEVMEMDVGMFPQLSFAKSKEQASDYDIIIRGLDELKGNSSKRQSVFEKIRSVFSDREVTADAELIDKLIEAIGYSIDGPPWLSVDAE